MAKAKVLTGAACAVAVIISLVMQSGGIRTNRAGLELIGNAESCRREPYRCPAGVLTDGIGNTHGVKPGTRKTDAQIAADWKKNIIDAESCVKTYANGISLSDNEFSAVVSVTFRAGCGNMKNSTMFRMFRMGNTLGACQQFSRWVYAAGKILPGLVTRAEKERVLCLR